MNIYDLKLNSLEQLPPVDNLPIISDCDGTIFEHGTTNLYPDVQMALGFVGCLALVSANPDKNLMAERKQILNADYAVNSDKPIWYKGKLFNEIAKDITNNSSKVVILGDRPVADVGIAKLIFSHYGIEAFGIRIDRPNQPLPSKLDYLLKPTFKICSKVAKSTRQDTKFRPNFTQSVQNAENFFMHRLNLS